MGEFLQKLSTHKSFAEFTVLNLESLRMEFIFEWNHLKEVGIGNLRFGVLLVDDCEPHNDGHYSHQEYESDYENTDKSNVMTKFNFSCGNRTTDNRI